eukprot:10854498-Alexandrium_andersonii.AAC.1
MGIASTATRPASKAAGSASRARSRSAVPARSVAPSAGVRSGATGPPAPPSYAPTMGRACARADSVFGASQPATPAPPTPAASGLVSRAAHTPREAAAAYRRARSSTGGLASLA